MIDDETKRIHEYNKQAYETMRRLAYFYCLQGRDKSTWKDVKPLEQQENNNNKKKEINEQQSTTDSISTIHS